MKIKQFFLWMFLAAVCVCFRTAESQAALNLDGSVYINEVNFPDARFREYIRKWCDYDGDSRITKEELEGKTWLEFGMESWCWKEKKPFSVEGIQYFSNLEKVNIYGYEYMEGSLKQNKNLKEISIYPAYHEPKKLNLTKLYQDFPMEQIESLAIHDYNIKRFNLKKATNLKDLWIEGKDPLKPQTIQSFDVSNQSRLQSLYIESVHIPKIDLRKNRRLNKLVVSMAEDITAWMDEEGNSASYWRLPEKSKFKTKLLLPKGNNIQEMTYYTANKILDITECKKIRKLDVEPKIKVKVNRKWYKGKGRRRMVLLREGDEMPKKEVPRKGKYMFI